MLFDHVMCPINNGSIQLRKTNSSVSLFKEFNSSAVFNLYNSLDLVSKRRPVHSLMVKPLESLLVAEIS
ncbi:hypothetical protein BpHYR1_031050 [Brachionus plicatilis]|uniref:Uncharacterized protein n=1 Tax=Brachionus plicatilis TaxID=10195 RepID=A0A3M7P3W8_BRAPC|nr:hypothetical protein BpHYR1_031050 [Brachionus plicatilis]